MRERPLHFSSIVCASFLLIFGVSATYAEQPSAEEDAQREKRLAEMKQRINGIEAHASIGGKQVRQKAHVKPLLRFNDSARGLYDGIIWAFGDTGRPSFLVTFERYETVWAWELISTSNSPVAVRLADGWGWSPNKSGLEFRALPGAEPPADDEARRLRQMKSMIRRFTATERTGNEQRYELRLLTQPILRYSDSKAGVADGAMFAFANGTNPEAIVLFECQTSESSGTGWLYAVVPMTTAAVTASLDGQQIWAKPHPSIPRSQEPYTYFGEEVAK